MVGKAIKRLERERGASSYGRKKKACGEKKNYCRPVWGEREERGEEGIIERQSKDVRVRTSETLPDVPRIPKKT